MYWNPFTAKISNFSAQVGDTNVSSIHQDNHLYNYDQLVEHYIDIKIHTLLHELHYPGGSGARGYGSNFFIFR